MWVRIQQDSGVRTQEQGSEFFEPIRSRRKKGRIPSPLDSWSATSVHIARGNTRPDLKIRLGLRVQSRLPSPNRAPPLRRFPEKQRTTTLPRPQRQRVGLFCGLGGYSGEAAACPKHCKDTYITTNHTNLVTATRSQIESRPPADSIPL